MLRRWPKYGEKRKPASLVARTAWLWSSSQNGHFVEPTPTTSTSSIDPSNRTQSTTIAAPQARRITPSSKSSRDALGLWRDLGVLGISASVWISFLNRQWPGNTWAYSRVAIPTTTTITTDRPSWHRKGNTEGKANRTTTNWSQLLSWWHLQSFWTFSQFGPVRHAARHLTGNSNRGRKRGENLWRKVNVKKDLVFLKKQQKMCLNLRRAVD